MKPFASKDQRWHAWKGTAHFLLSDEDNKHLTYHSTFDEMVNYLWLAGHQVAARELNQHLKEKQCPPNP